MSDVKYGGNISDGLRDPIQETVVLPNQDSKGNNYLKVLLLSNKKTRNNWIAPYKKIGDLPEEVKKSFLGIPYVAKHDHDFYSRMQQILTASGISDEEVHKRLLEESRKQSAGEVDFIFDSDPNAEVLYGQVKVTDPDENDYINKYNKPSKDFSSPAIFGEYEIADDGTWIYKLDSIRAFHDAGVSIPAFPEQEARVKGVCKNGNSETCSKALAFASYDPPNIQAPPMENVNNTCGCNKDINMSNNQTAQPTTQITSTPEDTTAKVTIPNNDTQNLLQGASQSTIDAMEKAKQEAAGVAKEAEKKVEEAKEEVTSTNEELKKLNSDLKKEQAEKLEMRNFFLEKMLVSTIPRDVFKKEDEFIAVKEKTKTFINKYNMGLEDADWLINTVANGIPKPESGKKEPIHGVGTAGLYNPDNFLKNNNTGSGSVPKQTSNSELEDSDYPIKF